MPDLIHDIGAIVRDHGRSMDRLGQRDGRSAALIEAAERLIDLGHHDAAKVVIAMLDAERIAALTERNELLDAARRQG